MPSFAAELRTEHYVELDDVHSDLRRAIALFREIHSKAQLEVSLAALACGFAVSHHAQSLILF